MNIVFRGEVLEVVFGQYSQNDNTAIQLIKDNELYTVASVNLIEVDENVVGIMNYVENDGLIESLIKYGVIHENKVDDVQRGSITIPYYELTEEAIKLRDQQLEEQ